MAIRTPLQYAAELITLLRGRAKVLSDLSGVTIFAQAKKLELVFGYVHLEALH
jgi:hypothetical protein